MGESRDENGWTPAPVASLLPWEPSGISGYRFLGRLGSGGMGTVYLSRTRGGQSVAVKVVHADLANEPRFRHRFEHEVRAARRVRGRFVASVVDSNTDGSVPWLATEYVHGPSLSQALSADGNGLTPRTVLRLVAGVASALTDMHAVGVTHRDLKPGNVMLSGDGPVVIDFGIAHAADATSLTGSRTRVGTPGYMAPEQVVDGAMTPAVDVFALGVTAFVAATARHPFGDGPPDALLYRVAHGQAALDACPAELRGVIEPCVRREPADRPAASEVLAACRETAAKWGMDDALPAPGWLPIVERSPVATDPTPDAVTVTGAPPVAPAGHPPTAPRYPPAPSPVPLADDAARPPDSPARPAGARAGRRPWVGVALAAMLVAGVGTGVVLANVSDSGRGEAAGEPGGASPADDGQGGQEQEQEQDVQGGGTDDPAPEEDGASEDPADDGPAEDEVVEDRPPDDGRDDPDDEATPADIPDFFLGTWHVRPEWDGVVHGRTMTVEQASPGEVAMVLTASMPVDFGADDDLADFAAVENAYHCRFEAELVAVTDGRVELSGSEVTVRKGDCLPGNPTVLVRDGEQLRRDNTDGLAPLTYTRVR